MLRVCYSENGDGQRWFLFGELSGPWVDEFRSCWTNCRRTAPLARAIVDLTDVTFIDEGGETLLSEMQSGGVEFVAGGVENQHLLANLQETNNRTLRRRMEHLRQSRGEVTSNPGGEK